MQKLFAATLAALTLGTVALLGTPTFAQTAPTSAPVQAHKKHEGQMKKLSAALNLTDDQKAQIKPILKSAKEQAKAVRSDTSLTPEEQKAKIKEIHKASKAQIMALLTPDQAAKMKAMKHHGHKNKKV